MQSRSRRYLLSLSVFEKQTKGASVTSTIGENFYSPTIAMGPKVDLRKSTGPGVKTPSKQSENRYGQKLSAFQYQDKIQQISSSEMTPSNKNKPTATGSVGLNDPARLPKTPATVMPRASLEMLAKASRSTGYRTYLARTSAERDTTRGKDIYDFIPDEMPLSERVSLSPAKGKQRTSRRKSSASEIPLVEPTGATLRKRTATRKAIQTETPVKKSKKNERNLCKRFMDKYGKEDLLREMCKEIEGERILEAYKENRTKEVIEQEAIRVLGLNPENNTNQAKTVCLQNIISELSKWYDNDNFAEAVMKTVSDKLNATKILNVLNQDELKGALLAKFTANELLNLAHTNDSTVFRNEILNTLSADEIKNHVLSRKDWRPSEPLLKVLLESFPQTVLEEPNPDLENTVLALIKATASVVKSKNYLKPCEQLFNIMLQNGPEVLPQETKESMKKFLSKESSRKVLAGLLNEILVPKKIKEEVIELD